MSRCEIFLLRIHMCARVRVCIMLVALKLCSPSFDYSLTVSSRKIEILGERITVRK